MLRPCDSVQRRANKWGSHTDSIQIFNELLHIAGWEVAELDSCKSSRGKDLGEFTVELVQHRVVELPNFVQEAV
jgi:isocitrate lyase